MSDPKGLPIAPFLAEQGEEDQIRPHWNLLYEPGSLGNGPIEGQIQLLSLLAGVEKSIEVALSESFIMIPKKSVSGIYFPAETPGPADYDQQVGEHEAETEGHQGTLRDREGGSDHLKVAVKYCGGCRAQYDRVKVVNSVKNRLGSAVEFVSAEGKDVKLLRVVNGCATACATVNPATELPTRFIGGPEVAQMAFLAASYTFAGLGDPTD